MLDKQGNLYTANLRGAAQTARYTLKGAGGEVFEPRFTFYGFRYVAVDGYPGEPAPENLIGVVVHSRHARDRHVRDLRPDDQPAAARTSSWGQKGNFVDVPTDCPQRDERLGWTGDAQVFARTAAFNMDVAGFFTKWLADVAADQTDDGRDPARGAQVLRRPTGGSVPAAPPAGATPPSSARGRCT